MAISFHAEDTILPKLDFDKLNVWLVDVVESFNFRLGKISIIFTSDNYLLNINRSFLNHDYFTDIISFDYSTNKKISGDLFISVDTVYDNSVSLNISFDLELHRVIVHGILHLIGFDDQTDESTQEMRIQENIQLLKIFPTV